MREMRRALLPSFAILAALTGPALAQSSTAPPGPTLPPGYDENAPVLLSEVG
jgi:hypothetical protein